MRNNNFTENLLIFSNSLSKWAKWGPIFLQSGSKVPPGPPNRSGRFQIPSSNTDKIIKRFPFFRKSSNSRSKSSNFLLPRERNESFVSLAEWTWGLHWPEHWKLHIQGWVLKCLPNMHTTVNFLYTRDDQYWCWMSLLSNLFCHKVFPWQDE